MYHVKELDIVEADPEEDIETLHVYVYDKEPSKLFSFHWRKETLISRFVQFLAIILLATFCLLPSSPIYMIHTITVPAHLLPIQTVEAVVAIIPTGIQNYPATTAQGSLTVYNGSFLAETLPTGFILTAKNGVEIITDQAVTIPPANPPSLGVISVTAHAVAAGESGNISAYAINETYGSALYIKNLAPFSGGMDAYRKQFIQPADVQKALDAARQQVQVKQSLQRSPGLLQKPCTQISSSNSTTVSVTWHCQYVTYAAPKNSTVLFAVVAGNMVVLRVRTIILPQ